MLLLITHFYSLDRCVLKQLVHYIGYPPEVDGYAGTGAMEEV